MDLIDKQAAIDAVLRAEALVRAYGYRYAADAVRELPSVQPQPVVRCKDCKYWQDNNGGYPHEDCRWGHDETPDGEDFCSFAERRTDERERT